LTCGSGRQRSLRQSPVLPSVTSGSKEDPRCSQKSKPQRCASEDPRSTGFQVEPLTARDEDPPANRVLRGGNPREGRPRPCRTRLPLASRALRARPATIERSPMAMKTSAILITGRSNLVVRRRMATREPSPKRMLQAPPQNNTRLAGIGSAAFSMTVSCGFVLAIPKPPSLHIGMSLLLPRSARLNPILRN